ncbi:BCCT family transporter [Maledivibacter halophilus]|uniref:Glycine betaine transporter n=1 Tax=Maledivibacter halophilus TaxID=36842 RepID=A0A1T5IKD2_9FIRM|nr:BCCT family transporter [Maledivibacter halophilus]SKC39605.1 glycine betaine transporter [Maledivibacter halophilus]
MKIFKDFEIEKGVFFPPAILMGLTLTIGMISTESFANWASSSLEFTINNFGWMYLLLAFIIFVFTLALSFSAFGKIKIGGEESETEVGFWPWCAMSVCGGIGVAMVFWAVAEPLTHYYIPPILAGAAPESPESAIRGLQMAIFHWSYVPYSLFAIFGVAVGYASYNMGLPFRPSSALYPLMGEKIYTFPGKLVDAISVLALIGGVITSLGFGTMQFASGLGFLFNLIPNDTIYVLIITILTVSYTFSSYRGLQKGMKIISSINSYIYVFLVIFLFSFGPTRFLLNIGVEAMGSLIKNFVPTALNIDAFNTGDGWSGTWTIFFWAWWMACAPLVGMFLARIAIGRTIRQLILVNIFIPGTFIFMWFTGFGGSAIYYDHFKNAGIMNIINQRGLEVSMYALLHNLPMSYITIPLGVIVLGFSFITLADAMTSTISAITTKNTTVKEAPESIKLFWGLMIGAVTVLCLLVSGEVGTQALQSMSIVYALPIFIFSIFVIISLLKMASSKEVLNK